MSTDVARIPKAVVTTDKAGQVQLLDPVTGEAFDLQANTDVLGQYLLHVREWEDNARRAKRIVSREIVTRMDAQAKYTLHAGRVKVSAPGPVSAKWDGEMAWKALAGLVEAGLVDGAVLDEGIIEQVTTYTVRKPGRLEQLRKLGGVVADLLNVARSETDARTDPAGDNRNITVKEA